MELLRAPYQGGAQWKLLPDLAVGSAANVMGSMGEKLLQIRRLQEQCCVTVMPHKDPHPNPDQPRRKHTCCAKYVWLIYINRLV